MPEESMLDVAGRATQLLRAGSGRTVLWLHDTFGNRWTPGHEALRAHFEVLAPTMPGFQDSTALDGIDSPEDVVFWLLDLLEVLSVESPALIGCGLGGWMAAELAVRHPDRLSSLVLVNSYGLQVDGALGEDEFALVPSSLRPLLFSEAEGELARSWLPDAEPAERMVSTLHARVAAARLAWQFPYSPKLRGRLPRARVRSLIVWGGRDGLVSPTHGEAFCAALPDSRLVVIDDAGHYPYLETPERFVAEVASFLGR